MLYKSLYAPYCFPSILLSSCIKASEEAVTDRGDCVVNIVAAADEEHVSSPNLVGTEGARPPLPPRPLLPPPYLALKYAPRPPLIFQ